MVYCMSLDAYEVFRDNIDPNFPEDAFFDQFRIRYHIFIEHFDWAIHRDDENKLEYDDFDRSNTLYHFAIDEETGQLLGAVRSNSTLLPYMLEVDRFKGSFYGGYKLPKDSSIFEGSRIVVDPSLYHTPVRQEGMSDQEYEQVILDQKALRRRTVAELFISQMEVAFDLGIDAYIGTMWPEVHKTTFGRMGWDLQFIGPETVLYGSDGQPLDGGKPTQNLVYPVCRSIEEQVRSTTGIYDRVTNYGVPDFERARLMDLLKLSTNSLEPDKRKAEFIQGIIDQPVFGT